MRALATLFVVFGLVALLENTGWISPRAWAIVWPITFIVIGAWILFRRGCCHCGRFGGKVCGACNAPLDKSAGSQNAGK